MPSRMGAEGITGGRRGRETRGGAGFVALAIAIAIVIGVVLVLVVVVIRDGPGRGPAT